MRWSLVPEVSVALLESLPSRAFDLLPVATQDAPWNAKMACLFEAGCQLIFCSWAGRLRWCSIKGWPVEMAFHWRQWGLKCVCHVWHGLAPMKGPLGSWVVSPYSLSACCSPLWGLWSTCWSCASCSRRLTAPTCCLQCFTSTSANVPGILAGWCSSHSECLCLPTSLLNKFTR